MPDPERTFHLIGTGTRPFEVNTSWSFTQGGAAVGAGIWPGTQDNDTALLDTDDTGEVELEFSLVNALIELRMFETDGSPFTFAGILRLTASMYTGIAKLAGQIRNGSDIVTTGNISSIMQPEDWTNFGGNLQMVGGVQNIDTGAESEPVVKNLVVNNGAGTATSIGQLFVEGSFTMTGGTLDMANNELSVAGDFLHTGNGDIINTTTVSQTASGGFRWNDSTNRAAHLRLAWGSGVTSTLTDTTRVSKFSFGAGNVDLSNKILFIIDPTADNFWVDGAGVVATASTGQVIISETKGNRQNGSITCDCNLAIKGDAGTTLTMAGHITIGSHTFTITGGNDNFILAMGPYGLRGDVTVAFGHVSDPRGAVLDFGTGSSRIAGITVLGGGGNCGLNFNYANITMIGELNGALMPAANIENLGAAIHGGTVSNLNCSSASAELNATNGVTDGTGNTNVVFAGDANAENYPQPGDLLLLGCGL